MAIITSSRKIIKNRTINRLFTYISTGFSNSYNDNYYNITKNTIKKRIPERQGKRQTIITRFKQVILNLYPYILNQIKQKELITKVLSTQNRKTMELENALSIKKPVINQINKDKFQDDKELI